jgi:hypothetical protein
VSSASRPPSLHIVHIPQISEEIQSSISKHNVDWDHPHTHNYPARLWKVTLTHGWRRAQVQLPSFYQVSCATRLHPQRVPRSPSLFPSLEYGQLGEEKWALPIQAPCYGARQHFSLSVLWSRDIPSSEPLIFLCHFYFCCCCYWVSFSRDG